MNEEEQDFKYQNISNILLIMYTENKPQLFLLHFAGGSCYSFDFLKKNMNADIEFIPLEIPGRGRRFGETLLKNKELVIQDYFNQIKKLRNKQTYVIYGHSMGATIGLSVTKKMEDFGDAPNCLVVSGNAGPGVKEFEGEKENKRYLMNDEEFKVELRELGGVPEEVLKNDDLYHFFNPIMRADFEVLEKDEDSEIDFVLKTSIYALMGSEEKCMGKIENWSRFTSGEFQFRILEGDHFFINNHSKQLAKSIETSFVNIVTKL